MKLFDITGKDIEQLKAGDFRYLIGRLCEADYTKAHLPIVGINYSGDDSSKDGGLDVIINTECKPPVLSFVPAKNTGFQVKKPKMSASDIKKEMAPRGCLQECIKNLISNNGAYIIASSSDNVSGSSRENRINAMKECVALEPGYENIQLKFYDQNDIASWVRLHPTLILWTRDKIGKSLSGWQPYENWSQPSEDINQSYLKDDQIRLYDRTDPDNNELSVEAGLSKIRTKLLIPGSAVRLIGLSGVGKTRFAQALFDNRIGDNFLNPSLAVYTNIGNDVYSNIQPSPESMAHQLAAIGSQVFLIVDNCSSELHQRLAKICSCAGNKVSLLSIEFDITDDTPENTDVFKLEESSLDLIERLLLYRFPEIGRVNAGCISNFSGGNARLALALATTIKPKESLSGMNDQELFKRLFFQRDALDKDLMLSAEVCSLFYSLNTNGKADFDELKFIATFIGTNSDKLYRDIKTLERKGLVQFRASFMAILPQAISNRLAEQALENRRVEVISDAVLNSSPRLIKSFSHRLKYIHQSKDAQSITKDWISTNGWLGENIVHLDETQMYVLNNIATVLPEQILNTLETAANGSQGTFFVSKENNNGHQLIGILRHIAFEPHLFERCVKLMCRFVLQLEYPPSKSSKHDALTSLFNIRLSGTHASKELRAKIVKDLLNSKEQNQQQLGLTLLEAALKAWHFQSYFDFEWAARIRDFGHIPKTEIEVIQWYEMFLKICIDFSTTDTPLAKQGRKILADKLRELWVAGKVYDAIEKSIKILHEQESWNEGWFAVKDIIHFDYQNKPNKDSERINRLEQYLKPKSLIEKIRTYVLLGNHHQFIYDTNDFSSKIEQIEAYVRQLGSEIVENRAVLDELISEFFISNSPQLRAFGKGLADASTDKQVTWDMLYKQYLINRSPACNIGVLLGYISSCYENDEHFYNSLLDQLVNDNLLCPIFPDLQSVVRIDSLALARLHKIIDNPNLNVNSFITLAHGRTHEAISDDDLAVLLNEISRKKGGIDVAIEILKMRFFEKNNTSDHSTNLLIFACNTLYSYISKTSGYFEHDSELALISNVCLGCIHGKQIASDICKYIKINSFLSPCIKLLESIASIYPELFLDEIIENNNNQGHFSFYIDDEANPLVKISDEFIINWCEAKPSKRYPLIMTAISLFYTPENSKITELNPLLLKILKKTTYLNPVLESLRTMLCLAPSSWLDSLADVFENRALMIQHLYEHDNETVREWAKQQHIVLTEKATMIRLNERDNMNYGFE